MIQQEAMKFNNSTIDCDSRCYTQEIDISFDKGKKMMSEIRAREKLNIN